MNDAYKMNGRADYFLEKKSSQFSYKCESNVR